MEVVFRRAEFNDVEGIIKLCDECFEEKTNIDYAKKVFLETGKDDYNIYIVGLIDREIVAHAKITIIPTIYEKMNTYAILNHICVKPEYRRHNIGSKLLDECAKISKEKGCKSMSLWSMNFRVPAHECYKKYGFEVKNASFFEKIID